MATSRVTEYFLCPEKGYAALVPPLATHGILAIAAVLAVVSSPYLGWDYSAPETAVMEVAIHALDGALSVRPLRPDCGTGRRFPDAEKGIRESEAPGE